MIYIAAPFFTPSQLDRIRSLESMLGSRELEYHSPRDFMVLKPNSNLADMEKVFMSNVEHMHKCSLIIALVDEPDTGTHWEMGYAFGNGISILMVSFNNKKVNVMLVQGCQGYIQSEEQLMKFLERTNGAFNWEVAQEWKKQSISVY